MPAPSVVFTFRDWEGTEYQSQIFGLASQVSDEAGARKVVEVYSHPDGLAIEADALDLVSREELNQPEPEPAVPEKLRSMFRLDQ